MNDTASISAESGHQRPDSDHLKHGAGHPSIIKLVDTIFAQAVKLGSSEIHIEVVGDSSAVSLNIDGRLRPVSKFPSRAHPLVTARIKSMSQLDISLSGVSQQGSGSITIGDQRVDFDAGFEPGASGDKIIVIFPQSQGGPTGPTPSAAQESESDDRQPVADQSQQPRVMIVDDSKSIRNLVKFVLQSEGYEVIEAEDGNQGWEQLQQLGGSIRLILSDFEMPGMSGMELVGKIRQQNQYDGIALIMLTSHKDEEDEVGSLDRGADDYICKPVEPMKSLARVRKMIRMYDRISNSAKG